MIDTDPRRGWYFTGLPGDAMRATGAIRVVNGRIAAIGDLAPEPGEEVIDASGCVIYPGLISTHHHLFQSILKGVRAGINLPLIGWLRSGPAVLLAQGRGVRARRTFEKPNKKRRVLPRRLFVSCVERRS